MKADGETRESTTRNRCCCSIVTRIKNSPQGSPKPTKVELYPHRPASQRGETHTVCGTRQRAVLWHTTAAYGGLAWYTTNTAGHLTFTEGRPTGSTSAERIYHMPYLAERPPVCS